MMRASFLHASWMQAPWLQRRKVWTVGGAVAALVLVLAGWVLFIHPQLRAAEDLRAQAVEVTAQNQRLQAADAELAEQSRQLPALRRQLAGTAAALPADSGLPALTRELSRLATSAHVALTALTVSGATPLDTAAGGSTATDLTGTSNNAVTGTANTATTSAGASTGTTFAIAVTSTTTGALHAQSAYVHGVQNGTRGARVDSVQLGTSGSSSAASTDAGATLTMQLTVYSAPMTATQIAALRKLIAGS